MYHEFQVQIGNDNKQPNYIATLGSGFLCELDAKLTIQIKELILLSDMACLWIHFSFYNGLLGASISNRSKCRTCPSSCG